MQQGKEEAGERGGGSTMTSGLGTLAWGGAPSAAAAETSLPPAPSPPTLGHLPES